MGEKAWEKKQRVYTGFMDLENLYDRVNREALWKVLRMYDVGGKNYFFKINIFFFVQYHPLLEECNCSSAV